MIMGWLSDLPMIADLSRGRERTDGLRGFRRRSGQELVQGDDLFKVNRNFLDRL